MVVLRFLEIFFKLLRDVSIVSIHSKFCLIVPESCGLGTLFPEGEIHPAKGS